VRRSRRATRARVKPGSRASGIVSACAPRFWIVTFTIFCLVGACGVRATVFGALILVIARSCAARREDVGHRVRPRRRFHVPDEVTRDAGNA
jgi:hypothetical protein